MSTTDRDAAFTIKGNEVQNPDQYRWQGGRSEKGVVSGKHYYEATITDNGLCRIGFATADAYQELGYCDLLIFVFKMNFNNFLFLCLHCNEALIRYCLFCIYEESMICAKLSILIF